MVSTGEPLVVPTTPPARVSVPPPLKVTFAPAIIKPLPPLDEFTVICPALLIVVPYIQRLSPSLNPRLSSLSIVRLLMMLLTSSVTDGALEFRSDLPSVVDSRAVYPKIVSVFEPQAVVTIDSQVVDDAVDVQRY